MTMLCQKYMFLVMTCFDLVIQIWDRILYGMRTDPTYFISSSRTGVGSSLWSCSTGTTNVLEYQGKLRLVACRGSFQNLQSLGPASSVAFTLAFEARLSAALCIAGWPSLPWSLSCRLLFSDLGNLRPGTSETKTLPVMVNSHRQYGELILSAEILEQQVRRFLDSLHPRWLAVCCFCVTWLDSSGTYHGSLLCGAGYGGYGLAHCSDSERANDPENHLCFRL